MMRCGMAADGKTTENDRLAFTCRCPYAVIWDPLIVVTSDFQVLVGVLLKIHNQLFETTFFYLPVQAGTRSNQRKLAKIRLIYLELELQPPEPR